MRGIANVKVNMHQVKRTSPVLPVETVKDPTPAQQHMKRASKSVMAGGNVASNTSLLIREPPGSEKTVDEIKTQTVLNYIIQRMLHL